LDYVKLCLDLGAYKAEEIAMEALTFQPELREYCEQNTCGRFGMNYACPPFVGDIHTLIAKIKTYPKSVIWQTVTELEDSFDFEGMMRAQKEHNAMTLEIADAAYKEFGRGNVLVLAAGGCAVCEKCAQQTDQPCRQPEKAISSLEAYGLNVSQIENISGMKYINGVDTVTYFSGLFIK
jgi:predicted metal-binding protein